MPIELIPIRVFAVMAMATCLLLPYESTAAPSSGAPLGSTFRLASSKPLTVTGTQAASADASDTTGTVATNRKSITFLQKSIRLVVHTGPSSDMLSYRIDGLRSPTLVVPRGASLRILFINNDNDMFHNIRFGAFRSTFPTSPDDLIKSSVGAAPIPHIDGATMHAADMVIFAPTKAGKYAYFCTVRGHAPGGMWGVIQAR